MCFSPFRMKDIVLSLRWVLAFRELSGVL